MFQSPTPRIDDKKISQKNHFLSRDDALRFFDGKPSAFTDLTDLPSKAVQDQKEKAKRDQEVNIRLKLRS